MTQGRDIGWYRRQSAAIGTITPSGNLTVERVTAAVLADFPEVSGHYSRTPVSGSSDPFPGGYDWDGMLGAARLLGDARVDAIVWNGSKGASLGFAADRELCRRVSGLTGIAATTSIIALEDVLRAKGMDRVAVVSPYTAPYQKKQVEGFAKAGFESVADACAGIADNLAYSQVTDAEITAMVERVAQARPQAVLTVCTNFPAAHLVADFERRLGIPVYDSVSIGVWAALRLAGVDTRAGARWGSLFTEGAPP